MVFDRDCPTNSSAPSRWPHVRGNRGIDKAMYDGEIQRLERLVGSGGLVFVIPLELERGGSVKGNPGKKGVCDALQGSSRGPHGALEGLQKGAGNSRV